MKRLFDVPLYKSIRVQIQAQGCIVLENYTHAVGHVNEQPSTSHYMPHLVMGYVGVHGILSIVLLLVYSRTPRHELLLTSILAPCCGDHADQLKFV